MYNKFRAQKTTIDGITFDSLIEGRRYVFLKNEQKKGVIRGLQCHKRFPLYAHCFHTGMSIKTHTYTPDFVYTHCETNRKVYEDVKSPATAKERSFVINKKIFEANYRAGLSVVLDAYEPPHPVILFS